MRVERIMCPVDFSESSTAALDDAASLAQQFGAQLLIVHVDEHPLHSDAASPSTTIDRADVSTQFELTTPQISGIAFEHHLMRGKPAEEIPRFARTHRVDLVVMGRHNAKDRLHFGNDGAGDLAARECLCPVLTIKHSAEHPPWVRVDGDGWSPL